MSLNPFAPDAAAVVGRHLDEVRSLPRSRRRHRGAGRRHRGARLDRVLLTNGGSEAIALVADSLGGSVVERARVRAAPRAVARAATWRSNPHNPTGGLAAPDERADVWDEAFYPLATGEWTRGDADAVVVGSLTKVFACPGLRLGYVLADDVDRFAEHRRSILRQRDDVDVATVVVVGRRDGRHRPLHLEAGGGCDVGERAVPVVPRQQQ